MDPQHWSKIQKNLRKKFNILSYLPNDLPYLILNYLYFKRLNSNSLRKVSNPQGGTSNSSKHDDAPLFLSSLEVHNGPSGSRTGSPDLGEPNPDFDFETLLIYTVFLLQPLVICHSCSSGWLIAKTKNSTTTTVPTWESTVRYQYLDTFYVPTYRT